MAPPRLGELVGGRYEILGLIGKGGQSSVFRARDTREGDEVALKVLKGDFAHDSDFRERMFREAQAMASLQGTAAVRVLDQAWTDQGALCLVTELLHGKDLESYLGYLFVERGAQTLVAYGDNEDVTDYIELLENEPRLKRRDKALHELRVRAIRQFLKNENKG